MVLEAIRYNSQDGTLKILDQLQLPYVETYLDIKSSNDAWQAIRRMQVRGAPAIAIVAALGLAVELRHKHWDNIDSNASLEFIIGQLDYLVTSRPTAVNLSRAAAELKQRLASVPTFTRSTKDSVQICLECAEQMLEEDLTDNMQIGAWGARWILEMANSAQLGAQQVSVLTHCNTGALATAGYGTALGVIRSLHGMGRLKRAFCSETRPYNQGSRLTAYELVHDNIPATLITDSMAAALLQLKGKQENIVAIVVGADRIAANGDTANKIGTYALAIHARYHGIKFVVAATRTTIDMNTHTGELIKIEERAPLEMTTVSGPRMINDQLDIASGASTISIAAPGIDVWNPGFDVTPHELIDAIVTEVGVAEKNANGDFNLEHLLGLPRISATNGHN